MKLKDLTSECMISLREKNLNTEEKDLRDFFCKRCRQNCQHAKWNQYNSLWEKRMSDQEEKLLVSPNLITDSLDKYSHIQLLEFKDMVETAMLYEISDKKNNWEVPEIFPSAFKEVSKPEEEVKKEEKGEIILSDENLLITKEEEKIAPIIKKESTIDSSQEESIGAVADTKITTTGLKNTPIPLRGLVLNNETTGQIVGDFSKTKEKVETWDIKPQSANEIKIDRNSTISIGNKEEPVKQESKPQQRKRPTIILGSGK